MTEEVGVVRRIVWREILPWLIIFRAFRISVSLPILTLAAIGWLLMPLGEQIGTAVFLGDKEFSTTDWTAPLNGFLAEAGLPQATPGDLPVTSTSNPLVYVYQRFTDPFVQLFDRSNSVPETAYHLFRGLWSIAVWAFFAGAITRIASVQLGRDERVDLRTAIVYSGRQYGWSVAAPLFPLFGVFLVSLPLMAIGFVLMGWDVGMIVASVLWPLALVFGLLMTILLLGLLAGWPLMWPTISSEEHGDAFEAFSCSFSYVFQRPLQYLFYLLLAGLIGSLGWFLVDQVSQAVIELTHYGTSWGASNERVDLISDENYTGTSVVLIQLFEWLVHKIAEAFNFSYFFCVLTAIYLVLRRDVDKTDFDEVFVEDTLPHHSLPSLESDEKSVRAAVTESATDKSDEESSNGDEATS